MKDNILSAAVRLAERKGFRKLTRTAVAGAAKVAPSLVSHYFESMGGLRANVVANCVLHGKWKVVGEALASRDPCALKLHEDVRKKAAAALV